MPQPLLPIQPHKLAGVIGRQFLTGPVKRSLFKFRQLKLVVLIE